MNTNETDWLKGLFEEMPAEAPSSSFSESVMKRINAEMERKRRRNEFMGLLSVIVASIGFIALLVGALVYSGIPKPELNIQELAPSASFYFPVGTLALFLLFIDHFLCRFIKKSRGL